MSSSDPNLRRRGLLLCLSSATAFGVAAVFAREAAATGVPVPTMLAGRFLIAAAVFWAIVRWRRRPLPPLRTLGICAAMGAVGYALQAALYFGALTRVDATLVGLVLYVYPALVVVLAVALRRERAEARTLLALGCSLAGLVLLLGGGGGTGAAARTGLAMALGAALTYALYITAAAAVLDGADLFVVSAMVCTAAATTLAVSAAATGTLVAPSAAGWGWIALLAGVSTVAAVGCFFAGVQAIGASKASVLSCAEPVVTALGAVALYGEALTPVRMAGGAAVLAAVVILQSRRRRPEEPLALPDGDAVPAAT